MTEPANEAHKLTEAVHEVAIALRFLTHDQRERVLLATAVLYGVIKPERQSLSNSHSPTHENNEKTP